MKPPSTDELKILAAWPEGRKFIKIGGYQVGADTIGGICGEARGTCREWWVTPPDDYTRYGTYRVARIERLRLMAVREFLKLWSKKPHTVDALVKSVKAPKTPRVVQS